RILFDEGGWDGPGPVHLPVHYRSARRPNLGRKQPRQGSDFPVHAACPPCATKRRSAQHTGRARWSVCMISPTPIIHLVDDDESLRTAVTRLLRSAGFEVRSYPSAGEFILARPANTPGCLVLDVTMPGPSGLDLQKALRKQGDALPI